MKIKMITTIAGPELAASSGQEITVDDKKAKELIDGKYAVAVEIASVAPKENAAKPKPRGK